MAKQRAGEGLVVPGHPQYEPAFKGEDLWVHDDLKVELAAMDYVKFYESLT